MRYYRPTRRNALKTAAALVTVSVSARSLGLSAAAQVPDKIVLGTLSIGPAIGSYVGEVDFFKEESLTVELTRFNNFAPVMQAMTAGSLLVGEIGVAPSIIGLTRGVPLVAPFLCDFSTPGHPLERIMVMENSRSGALTTSRAKSSLSSAPARFPTCFSAPFPKGQRSAKRT
jgi:hypothetical protein